MFDVLTTLHKATCAHCGGAITFLKGSLVGGDWYHDEGGQKPCPGTPTAFPVESTIRDATVCEREYGGRHYFSIDGSCQRCGVRSSPGGATS